MTPPPGPGPEVSVHPAALCETDRVGAGTRIWAFAHLLPGATVGTDCNICDHVFIEGGARVGNGVTLKNGVVLWDGVTVEDEVFLGPHATFTNDYVPRAHTRTPPAELGQTIVRRGASIGANATVVCGVTVGAHALVGAGTVVVRDVPSHAVVVGNPARQLGWVCRCGGRLDDDLCCPVCGTRHQILDSLRGLQALS